MAPSPFPPPIRVAAHITQVREVALWGQADLGFWQRVAAREGVAARSVGGQAELMLCATALAWKGVRFRELIVTLAASGAAGGDEGFLLLHAFNSNRLLALAERSLFKTPYSHGDIGMRLAAPAAGAGFEAGTGGKRTIAAAMGGGRSFGEAQPTSWQGPIYLPRPGERHGRHFFVRLSGDQICAPSTLR